MPAHNRALLVFLLVGLGILGGSIYGFYEQDRTVPLAAGTYQEAAVKPEITAYVCGAVNQPGVIRLPEGARIVDAVKACGGLLPLADATKLNMAQPVKEGMQITVPEKLAAAAPGAGSASPQQATVGDKININTADAAELDKLPGIGPAMAAAIIEHRTAEGAFQTLEDLMKVRGIGAAKFKKLKDKATL